MRVTNLIKSKIMKLKNIFNILMMAVVAVPFLAACDDDTDSNPTFHEADTFTLNESAYATNNTIDLSADGAVISLTCNQPDYGGYPLAVVYSVQLSLDGTYVDATDSTVATYTTMSTTFTSTQIDIDASEMNTTLIDLYADINGEEAETPTDPIAVYVRLTANVSGQSIGYCESNVICLPNVLLSASAAAAADIALPEHMYLAGSHNGWTFAAMGTAYGVDGYYYQVVYLDTDDYGNNGSFKFGTKEDEWLGADDSRLTITYDGELLDNNDANIMPSEGGWYTIIIYVSSLNGDYLFDMTITEAEVYVINPTSEGAWAFSDTYKFYDSGNGTLLSQKIDAVGELRMAVAVSDLDWWRTEFTLCNGSIYFRDCDIPDNWASNVGSDYSVTVTSGNVVELNFNELTGSVK